MAAKSLQKEIVQLRARFASNSRLRLEFLGQLSSLLHRFDVAVTDEMLASISLATMDEIAQIKASADANDNLTADHKSGTPAKNSPKPKVAPKTPANNPPAPDVMPKTPANNPPAPEIAPRTPANNPPAPEVMPRTPANNPPAPDVTPKTPANNPPAPEVKPGPPAVDAPKPEAVPTGKSGSTSKATKRSDKTETKAKTTSGKKK